MKVKIADEPIAIIAKRSEWAGLLCELGDSPRLRRQLHSNPETMEAADSHAEDPALLVDTIAITTVDTQLRTERNTPPDIRRVKILKSASLLRSPWETSDSS